jgi:PPOX class probable F420-dependent enzyme
MNDLQRILDFLRQHKECVLATVGPDGRPQAAVVGYSENDMGELMFGTVEAHRKYQNLKRDSRVAVVVGFEGFTTVQYEGVARQLAGKELAERQKAHFVKLPEVEKYKDDPGEVYFSISPTWMRLTNTSIEPWEIQELRFDDERV